MKIRHPYTEKLWYTEKPWLFGVALVCLIGGVMLISTFIRTTDNSLLCNLGIGSKTTDYYSSTPIQLNAVLHYATSHRVPQQSLAEIRVSFNVLKSLSPCNFLVFGLGHDSLMWTAFNPRGTTLFLEEDPRWVQNVLKESPDLRVHTVRYRTKLKEADALISLYRTEPECSPSNAYLRGNKRCKLALHDLADEVYDTEWDLIMIDAPRGYFNEAPGRMGAIFSAAVMARNRKGSGVTHVFLHDNDRRVEKSYASEFLCRKYLVKTVGRLWHFEIPPANVSDSRSSFC
ncbi:arabinogalactan O-methyltransferase 1-like [Cornus florida]|uniref:arabinogalactan O-methyltransferase 1-like n=1 Tax=Cornus florida TaxID=4283 RepID=UPI00289A32A4|nr:arabinogalactan O-methyltransferase 1-like [Cornus florida]